MHSMSVYLDLTVREVIRETSDAITIVFEHPGDALDYRAGQFLTLICEVKGAEIRRSYSLCTSPWVDEYPAVTVKRVADGLMSNHLNNTITAGNTIKVMKPMGHFTIDIAPHNKRHVVLMGGGSGITPLMGIAKSVLSQEPESRVSLVYANRDLDSIIFKTQWEQLATQYPERLTVVHSLDQAPPNWQGPAGMVTPDKLVEIIKQLPNQGVHSTEYFICGPNGLMNAIFGALEILGVPKDRIKRELFVNNSSDKKNTDNNTMAESNAQNNEALVEDDTKDYEVTIILDGEEHTFTVEAGYSILETGLDEGIDMPYSCQSGLCTACRGKLLSGKVKMDETEGLSDEEMEEGYVLNCVGHPVTEGVRIEIG